jgi:triphosphatase
MRVAERRELELKLELTRNELGRVRAHPALPDLTVGTPVTRTLRAIYFDTPDHRLRASGISFRVHSEGSGWLQRVERIAGGTGRGQMGGDVAVERPEPDVSAIVGRAVRKRVAKAVARSVLAPVFETVVQRTTQRLHAAEGELELALDEGVMRAGEREDAVIEAELELKSGSPLTLLETAAKLFANGPVRLAASSKAERGYTLARRRSNGAVATQRTVQPALRREQTCGEALRLIVQAAGDQIVANRRAVLETEDPSAAHQLRIGLRRLRSALRAFRPLHDAAALRALEGHARALGRCVGELRDADVLIEEIYAPVADTVDDEGEMARVREALLAHRAAARARVREGLSGGLWSALQLYLALWPHTLEHADRLGGSLVRFAPSAIKRQWKKVADRGAHLGALTIEERHEMRKTLKGLRYTCEFFLSLYPEHKANQFLKEIRGLQEVFGYLNDVVAAQRLGAICRSEGQDAQRAAAYILGWHSAQASHAWKRAHKGWRKLERLAHVWE